MIVAQTAARDPWEYYDRPGNGPKVVPEPQFYGLSLLLLLVSFSFFLKRKNETLR